MSDWNTPVIGDTHSNILSNLKARDVEAAEMDWSSATNIPNGAVRANTTSNRIEKYNGSTWDDVLTDYTTHLTAGGNPHSVSASDVGNGTAQWNANKLQGVDVTIASVTDNEVLAYDTSSGDWINQTATEADLATKTNLDAHEADTANPHSVTAVQVSAFAVANNLSEGTASTMRSNLGLGSIATQSTVNNGDWSGTDLAVANGGTGSSTASGARSNLSAAASGVNSDITSLTGCSSMTSSANMTIGGNSGYHLLLRAGATDRIELDDSNNFFPVTAGGMNLGTASNWWNGISASTLECASGASTDLTLANGGTSDILMKTDGTNRVMFDHSENSWRPFVDNGANLGTSSASWFGFHVNTINFTGTTGGAPGAVVGTIAIQVGGVSRNLAYY